MLKGLLILMAPDGDPDGEGKVAAEQGVAMHANPRVAAGGPCSRLRREHGACKGHSIVRGIRGGRADAGGG